MPAPTPRELLGLNEKRSPTLDHRVPLSKGGHHTYANSQLACDDCNVRKGAKLPEQFLCDPVDLPAAGLTPGALPTRSL